MIEPLRTIHMGLSQTAILYFAALGLWALFYRVRSRPLDGSWYGAGVIAWLLMVLQLVSGFALYSQGLGVALPRPAVHILYGVVSVVTPPSAYAYLGKIENENAKSVVFALVSFFLMGVVIRARMVA